LSKNIKLDLYEVDFSTSGFNSDEDKYYEVDFEKETINGDIKNKTYTYSGGILKIYLNVNCCNTDVDILTD